MHTHSQRLERWLGVEAVNRLTDAMRHWYGPPIAVDGVPGRVYACKGGDFIGRINAGSEVSALERADSLLRRSERARRVLRGIQRRQSGGFADYADLLAEVGRGKISKQIFDKTISTGVGSNMTSDFWMASSIPVAGALGAAAPGGTVHADGDTGTYTLGNVSSDTRHFIGGEARCDVTGHTLLIYDRLFSVAKTMNDTSTEAVTGVPTRYTSTTASDPDYIGGNYVFPAVGSSAVLASTAHNWTVCTYTDQGGNASTFPSAAGVSGAFRSQIDLPVYSWFMPLEAGDVGVKALTQMQCDAAVATGTINFVIAHPIAFMAAPLATTVCINDGILTAFNFTRVFDGACLAFLEVNKTSSSVTIWRGNFSLAHG